MIYSKEDMKTYLRNDCFRNTGRDDVNILWLAVHFWYGNDGYIAYRYLRSLRRYEYTINCLLGPVGKLRQLWAKIANHRLAKLYGIQIKPNVVGSGLRLPHVVCGVGNNQL